MGERGSAHTIVEAKSKERDRLKNNAYKISNTKMYLEEIGWERIEWIHLAQDWKKWRAFVNTVRNFQTA